MLLLGELVSILASVVLEVSSHQGPPAQLSKACDFLLLSNLLVWRCAATRFGALMVVRLQLYTPERRGSTVSASYMWFVMPKEPSLVYRANLFWTLRHVF